MEDYKVMTLNEPLFFFDTEEGDIDRLIGFIIEKLDNEFHITNVITKNGFIFKYDEDDGATGIYRNLVKGSMLYKDLLKNFQTEEELMEMLEGVGCPLIE